MYLLLEKLKASITYFAVVKYVKILSATVSKSPSEDVELIANVIDDWEEFEWNQVLAMLKQAPDSRNAKVLER